MVILSLQCKILILNQGYWNDDYADKDIKKFTYFIAFVNFCLKIVLAVSLSVNETKKSKKAKQAKFDASRKTLFGEKSEKFSNQENQQAAFSKVKILSVFLLISK